MFLLVVSPIVLILPRKVQLIVSLFVNFWATELVTRYYGTSQQEIDDIQSQLQELCENPVIQELGQQEVLDELIRRVRASTNRQII